MKKTIISMLTLCLSLTVTAQPQGGPGGFHKPENTATFKNINYAGDKLEAHQLDIYLPEKKQDKMKE
jgi:hypothetical protein